MSGPGRSLILLRPLGLLLAGALSFCLGGARAASPPPADPPPLRGGFTVTHHGSFSWGYQDITCTCGRRGDLSLVQLREMLTYSMETGFFTTTTHQPSRRTDTGAAAGHSDLVGLGDTSGWDPHFLHPCGLIHALAEHPKGTQNVEQYFRFYCPRCGMSAATPGDVPNSGFEHQQQVAPTGTNVYLLTASNRPHAQGSVQAGTVTNSQPQKIRIP